VSLAQDDWLLATALLLTLCAAVWDVRTGLIPNRLVLWGLAASVCARMVVAVLHDGSTGVVPSLLSGGLGLLLCALVPLLLYALRGIGGGDVKLLAVCGFCLGPLLGWELQLYAFSLGSLYAFARLAYQGVLFRTLTASAVLLSNPILPKPMRRKVGEEARVTFRFGPAIFVAALVASFAHWGAR
jgi:prepilin peptidase CpaA